MYKTERFSFKSECVIRMAKHSRLACSVVVIIWQFLKIFVNNEINVRWFKLKIQMCMHYYAFLSDESLLT